MHANVYLMAESPADLNGCTLKDHQEGSSRLCDPYTDSS